MFERLFDDLDLRIEELEDADEHKNHLQAVDVIRDLAREIEMRMGIRNFGMCNHCGNPKGRIFLVCFRDGTKTYTCSKCLGKVALSAADIDIIL